MSKVYSREEFKSMSFKQAANLSKEQRKIRDRIKHIDKNKIEEFLLSVKENLSDKPFTESFIEKHLYKDSEKLSKRDHAISVAKNRQYRNSTKNGMSSIVDISDKEMKKELAHAAKNLTSDDFTVNANRECELKKSLPFTTKNSYPVREAPLLFSRKGREVGQLERKQAQITFGLTIEDRSIKVNHFDKNIHRSRIKP